MPAAAWLRESPHSKNLYVIAPDSTATEAEIAAVMERHDGIRDGWAGSKPGWFKAIERIGYWWYLIATVLGSVFFVLFAPTDNSVWMKAILGISAGPVILLALQILVFGTAWIQVRLTNGSKRTALREADRLARPATAVSDDKIGAILAVDPAIEAELHRLCWTASGVGAEGRGAALDRIHELWRRADPAGAAEVDAKLRDLEEMLERHRKNSKS